MKVCKKPVIVEAWQVVSRDFDLPSWINEALYVPVNERTMFWNLDDLTELKIQTLEGLMTAKIGDYIIKGVEGELYPVRKDIFEKTYEVVE